MSLRFSVFKHANNIRSKWSKWATRRVSSYQSGRCMWWSISDKIKVHTSFPHSIRQPRYPISTPLLFGKECGWPFFLLTLGNLSWHLSSCNAYLVPSRLLNALNCFVPFWGYHHCTQQAAASRGVRCCRHQLQTSHFPDKVCDKIKWNKLQPKWKCCPARHLR